MSDSNNLLEPLGWTKKPFQDWSDQALDAFIIMTQDQVSSSILPRNRSMSQKKLDDATVELNRRRQIDSQQVVKNHSELVMKEEVNRTYGHAMSGSQNT